MFKEGKKFHVEIVEAQKEVTPEEYENMLGAVPPIRMVGNAFLVGEPEDMPEGYFRYHLYFERDGKFYHGGLATTKDFDMMLIPA